MSERDLEAFNFMTIIFLCIYYFYFSNCLVYLLDLLLLKQ